jgi:hypothetical protein
VSDLVYSDSFIPLSLDSGRWMLSGNVIIRGAAAGKPPVALTGRWLLLGALTDCYGADPNIPSHTIGAAFPPGPFVPAAPGDREEHRRPGVPWRCDGR